MTAPPLLELAQVGRRLGGRWVLRGLDLSLRAGERVALLGESGSGKSTLLNLVAGLDAPDEGRIRFDGQILPAGNADASAALRRDALGFVFQAFHLIAHLTLAQNVAVPLLLQGCPRADALARADALLARVGLGGRGAGLPRELSGGEQQRVALARALVHRPRLVLADEPTGNLDPATAARALRLIEDEIAASGAALLMVTHSTQAAGFCDRRLTLHDGILRPG
ncbi:MAG: ABC transporter ATP-binding protein [Betaproteobacteria bacterium]|nr:ABC transporter ATP-binding protein [Betaproteobacteria bacterium]